MKLLRRSACRSNKGREDLQVLHSSLTSNGSESSTFLVAHDKKASSCQDISLSLGDVPLSRRRVSFAVSNKVYNHDQECSACFSERWYSADEIKTFKAQTVFIAKAVMDSESLSTSPSDNSLSWPRRLQDAYFGFCQDTSNESNIYGNMPVHKATAAILALDKWVVRSIARDKTQRRRRILKCIQEIQQADDCVTQTNSATLIAQVSRELSQPSRLYATHVAHWWKREADEDDRIA